MNARLTLDEQRDIAIAEKTAAHAATIRAAVAAGEPPIGLIADGVTDLLCDSKLASQIARLSAVVPNAAGAVHAFLTAQVIAEQAEFEAIKEVEREEASVSSADRQRMRSAQVRAEISAAYGGNPAMLKALESRAEFDQNMGIFGYGGMG